MKKILLKSSILILIAVWAAGYNAKSVSAQESISVLYVPLIGITSVPEPLALPDGAGNVTYNYAVKNFIKEIPLNDIKVDDDKCSPIKYTEGDDNNNSQLDYDETWRYTCKTRLFRTTESIATVWGHNSNIAATHKAYATVVVGEENPAPLVSIVNITKVAYPLSLPREGGKITFTYKVNNPGSIPLSNVIVSDDKCSNISSRLGDTNSNNRLDPNEVWIYTCSTTLTETTTNTVKVTGSANGLGAFDSASITVKVDNGSLALAQNAPGFPETGMNPDLKTKVWKILVGIFLALLAILVLKRIMRTGNKARGKVKSGRSGKK